MILAANTKWAMFMGFPLLLPCFSTAFPLIAPPNFPSKMPSAKLIFVSFLAQLMILFPLKVLDQVIGGICPIGFQLGGGQFYCIFPLLPLPPSIHLFQLAH
jgi:hypothetical protein